MTIKTIRLGLLLAFALVASMVAAPGAQADTVRHCGNAFRAPDSATYSSTTTVNLSCAKGRAITRAWTHTNACGAGDPCLVAYGFTCRDRSIGVEVDSIRCRRRDRLVAFRLAA